MSNIPFLDEYFLQHGPSFEGLYSLCKPETGTSLERMQALFASVHYVLDNNIPGDFVECGVWRGGSAMLMASILAQRGIEDRSVWLYDTFEGMTEPTERDIDYAGAKAADSLEAQRDYKEVSGIWCYAAYDIVAENMRKTGLPSGLVKMVKGPVEQTIPGSMPTQISLLRLDTDWYESTLHEMAYLYPRLSKDGVLIIDDYGHWQGCRQAIDEYFEHDLCPLELHHIDYTGRAAIKKLSGASTRIHSEVHSSPGLRK